MKIYDVFGKNGDSGEQILGSRDTGSHACYLIHGVLKPGEKGRELNPGKGHEELVLVIAGELQLSGQCTGMLKQGQAIHLQGAQSCYAENPGATNAVYVISGGHSESEQGHHH
jgi:uncharacterized cupin superfamily protein